MPATAATSSASSSVARWRHRCEPFKKRRQDRLLDRQPIQRFEDRPLVTGQGTFTADLKAELYARFVRSPLASGRIVRIAAPEGIILITAKDLVGVQPIHLILKNFNYIPVEQTILARDVVRF